MAIRLSVVMIHTPPAGAGHQNLSESLVGELIGLPGIDLTLVGPLSTLRDSSTDRLTLESLSGDVALLDWQPVEPLFDTLDAIGFRGNRTPHPDDPVANGAEDPGARRIYAFDLSQFSDAREVVAALVQLRDHRQVRTVSIGLASIRPPTDVPRPTPASKMNTETRPGGNAANSRQDRVRPDGERSATTQPAQTEPPTLDLDDLLDQLDELDP